MTVKLVIVNHACTQPECGTVVGKLGAANLVEAYTLQDGQGNILYWARARRGMTAQQDALALAQKRGWTVENA